MQNQPKIDWIGLMVVSGKYAAAIVASFWLSIPVMMQLLIYSMILDFASGLLAAIITGVLNSQKSFRGLAKKIFILILVTAGAIISRVLELPIHLGEIISGAFVINEAISIIENAARSGVPIPPILLSILTKAKSMTGRGVDPSKIISQLDTASSTEATTVDGTHIEIKSTSSETVSKP